MATLDTELVFSRYIHCRGSYRCRMPVHIGIDFLNLYTWEARLAKYLVLVEEMPIWARREFPVQRQEILDIRLEGEDGDASPLHHRTMSVSKAIAAAYGARGVFLRDEYLRAPPDGITDTNAQAARKTLLWLARNVPHLVPRNA